MQYEIYKYMSRDMVSYKINERLISKQSTREEKLEEKRADMTAGS